MNLVVLMSDKINLGDIIKVKRSFPIMVYNKEYWHYGVYIGNEKVIHYSSGDSDISSENMIICSSLNCFLRGVDEIERIIFPDEYDKKFGSEKIKLDSVITPHNIPIKAIVSFIYSLFSEQKKNDYKIYSPSEVVERAKSRLYEQKYNLIFNNCEHFAIWCKTGVKGSKQVEEILDTIFSQPFINSPIVFSN